MNEKGVHEAGGEGYLVKFNATDFFNEFARVIKKQHDKEQG